LASQAKEGEAKPHAGSRGNGERRHRRSNNNNNKKDMKGRQDRRQARIGL
jgi:hypothetical protein